MKEKLFALIFHLNLQRRIKPRIKIQSTKKLLMLWDIFRLYENEIWNREKCAECWKKNENTFSSEVIIENEVLPIDVWKLPKEKNLNGEIQI